MDVLRWAIGPAVVLLVSPAWAAAGSEGGRVGLTLFAVALLVTSAKIGGLVLERWGQPAVLGELLVGIGLGNVLPLLVGGHGVDLVRADPTLHFLAEVGVLLLLFEVGLESDLRALIRVGPSALLVAMLGVVAPVALGWGVTALAAAGESAANPPLHRGHACGHQRRHHGAGLLISELSRAVRADDPGRRGIDDVLASSSWRSSPGRSRRPRARARPCRPAGLR